MTWSAENRMLWMRRSEVFDGSGTVKSKDCGGTE